MASAALTRHDRGVLDHIKDPESGPAVPLLIDDSLPKDPHYTDASDYQTVAQRERAIIASIQQAEFQNIQASAADHLSQYLACIANLDELINEFPKYASARNNRAQALRRVYGDLVLVRGGGKDLSVSPALDAAASEGTIMDASSTILSDLDAAITLLTPRTSFAALSPQAAKTLSQSHTQRGALYHLTAKHLPPNPSNLLIHRNRREAVWTTVDFESAASRDFVLGGRYGNEVAKALAVSSNPTAKLCGDIMRTALREEYGGGVGGGMKDETGQVAMTEQ